MDNATAAWNINRIPRKRYPAVGLTSQIGMLKTAGFTPQQAAILGKALDTILSQQAINEQMIYEIIEQRMNSEIATWSTTKTTAPLPTTVSRKYRVRFGGLLDEITAELNTAGTTNTIYDVLVNGIVVYTITFEAGNTEDIYIPDMDDVVRVNRGDLITNLVTTAGTGAIGLSIHGWISR